VIKRLKQTWGMSTSQGQPYDKRLTRRALLGSAASAGLWLASHQSRLKALGLPSGPTGGLRSAPFPVHFHRKPYYESLVPYVEPGHDAFPIEKDAGEITDQLNRLPEIRSLPVADNFQGRSPLPARYHVISSDVSRAEFEQDRLVDAGSYRKALTEWLDMLGTIRSARFFVLPHDRVRYEISSQDAAGLHHRVGLWEQVWADGHLLRSAPLEECHTSSSKWLFEDITSSLFDKATSFKQQLLRGVPYWRACLDSATGIDIYGENGIAVGDIDGDGWDEIYVCQPAGVPNRLYKNLREKGMADITEEAGVGVLDDTSSALFVDFRNRGIQDLVVLTSYAPLLFLNQGNGSFTFKPRAFRFESKPQGSFNGMAAADYDRDGRVDLYLCCYVYFQSEDQYRYPIPYHDAENGPPNFMFRNELKHDGEGVFSDVTEAVGLNHNNSRFSFAPAWCDYDGDGWPDLYVANDFGRNNLYKNEHGHFRDVAAEAGVEDIGPGMSASWFDYDGDGRPDLYVSNMWTAPGQRVISSPGFTPAATAVLREAYRRHTKGNSLYRSRGDGTFEETGPEQGVEMGRWAWCSDGVDWDNDGAPEIFVATGMFTNSSPSQPDLESFFWRQVVAKSPQQKSVAPEYERGWDAINELLREDFNVNSREPNVLYARRAGRFYDFSGISGLDYADDSRAFAAVDFDGDGNLDLILKSRLGPQIRALRNDWGVGRKVLAIQLRGTRSNRDAIGAVVEVTSGKLRNWQFVRAGSGYISQRTKTLHFGLGDNPAAELLTIRWPSGAVQEFRNLPAGFIYIVEEGLSDFTRRQFLSRGPARAFAPVTADNQPPLEPAWLLEPVPLPERRKGPAFLCLVNGQIPDPPRGVPFELLDLSAQPPDVGACYALFRKYLFDYRTDLILPLVIMVDGEGSAQKVYPTIPSAAVLSADLERMKDRGRNALALPFVGKYYTPPVRNFFRLGAAFLWSGYPEVAVIYLNEVVRRTPDNFLARLCLGQIHLEAGRIEEAREHLGRAAELNPESASVWNDLAGVEMRRGSYPAALKDLEKALAIKPDDPSALINCGLVYSKLENSERAEKMFRRAVELDSNDAEAAGHLGSLLADQGRFEEARKYLQQAIAARSDYDFAINNLGVLYLQVGKINDAIAAFRYGTQVAPDNESINLNLARAYLRAGDKVKAREALTQLLSLHNSVEARNLLQQLAGL
jgi:Tfp pilus assembly protein PilF